MLACFSGGEKKPKNQNEIFRENMHRKPRQKSKLRALHGNDEQKIVFCLRKGVNQMNTVHSRRIYTVKLTDSLQYRVDVTADCTDINQSRKTDLTDCRCYPFDVCFLLVTTNFLAVLHQTHLRKCQVRSAQQDQAVGNNSTWYKSGMKVPIFMLHHILDTAHIHKLHYLR